MNLWRQALQEYNSGKKYSIPKKGTPEYDEVKKIQDKLSKGGGMSNKPVTTSRRKPSTAVQPMTEFGDGNISFEGGGIIKDSFTGLVKRLNKQIDKLEPVQDDIPLGENEYHLKKIVRKDGKFKRHNYNYCGPGTQVDKRLARGDKPIDKIDLACQEHDVTYTKNFQERAKRGEKVPKAEVQAADKKFVTQVQLSRNDNPLFAAAVPKLFGAKKLAENTGLLPPDAFFNPATTGSGIKKTRNRKKKM